MTIHPTALIDKKASFGKNLQVGPYSIIHKNVVLGDNVKIEAYCELGYPSKFGDGSPLVIGNNSLIRSRSLFYESSSFGDGLVTGHDIKIREKTKAGLAFQIGTSTEIQGDCSIGDYVRFQSNVFVGKNTIIGNFVWVLPYVILTNDPTPPSNVLVGAEIGDYAVLAASSLILPGVKIGNGAVVAAKACVTKDVQKGILVAGVPAKVIGKANQVKLVDGSGMPAYPWNSHFTRGYPPNVLKSWKGNI